MKYGGRSLANIEEGKVTEEKDRNMPSESEEMPHKSFEYSRYARSIIYTSRHLIFCIDSQTYLNNYSYSLRKAPDCNRLSHF